MTPVDPAALLARQLETFRAVVEPHLREYGVASPEHVSDVLAELIHFKPNALATAEKLVANGNVARLDEFVKALLQDFDGSPRGKFQLEPIPSPAVICAAFIACWWGPEHVDFSASGHHSGGKASYSRAYIFNNYAQPGGGICEARRHLLKLRRDEVAAGREDPLPSAILAAAREEERGFPKPRASRSSGIAATACNPPPVSTPRGLSRIGHALRRIGS